MLGTGAEKCAVLLVLLVPYEVDWAENFAPKLVAAFLMGLDCLDDDVLVEATWPIVSSSDDTRLMTTGE